MPSFFYYDSVFVTRLDELHISCLQNKKKEGFSHCGGQHVRCIAGCVKGSESFSSKIKIRTIGRLSVGFLPEQQTLQTTMGSITPNSSLTKAF